MPVSITLGLWSTLIAYLVSIPLGIRKAVRDGTTFDTWTSGMIIVAYAIPGFLFAILLLVLFAGGSYFQIFPLRGLTSDNWEDAELVGKIADYFWHITLPVLASTISAFATLTLLTKNSFLDEIKKQYVMTARAKGLSESRVLYGHVFRNAMLIVIAGFPAVFIGVFFGGADHRDDLLARRAGAAGLRGGGGARLPGDLRHAVHLRADRPGRRDPVGPDVCAGRSAHRLREAGGLSHGSNSREPDGARPKKRKFCAVAAQPAALAQLQAQPRAYWSLIIFSVLFGLSLFAEFIANDKPILVSIAASYTRSSTSIPRPPSAAISRPRRSIATPR
jgi:ABC-type proline/glycine betaine transport system permease subunit